MKSTFCGRCGLPFGEPPRSEGELAVLPHLLPDDGRGRQARQPGLARPAGRTSSSHLAEHDHHSVGDDDYLESLREGDRIRIGRWTASFDVVRRYLVTGAVDGGRRRAYEHDMIVTAMTSSAACRTLVRTPRDGAARRRLTDDQAGLTGPVPGLPNAGQRRPDRMRTASVAAVSVRRAASGDGRASWRAATPDGSRRGRRLREAPAEDRAHLIRDVTASGRRPRRWSTLDGSLEAFTADVVALEASVQWP